MLQEDQRRTPQHLYIWKQCNGVFNFFHFFHFFYFKSSLHFLFYIQDESFRAVFTAMEQGNVKSLTIRTNCLTFSSISFNSFFFTGQQITKEISTFLSRDVVVLEELDLGLKEKKKACVTALFR